MKYGLIVYKNTDNIGDDVQTYVAKRFLPQVDYYLEREELDEFLPNNKEEVAVIMNGWFLHKKYNFPPSQYILPLLTSMHFVTGHKWTIDKSRYLEEFTKEYLQSHGSVGSRDYVTLEKLNKLGIDTYFSGCMTLTLNKFDEVKQGGYICAVDLSEESINKLKSITDKEIKYITHSVDPKENNKLSIETRLQKVEELLKTYQGADFVVTTRLHCALPCVALEVPVVLLHDEDSINRIESFIKFIKNGTERDFNSGKIDLNFEKSKDRNPECLEIRNKLIKQCEDFIDYAKNKKNDENLLDIEEYKKINKFDYIKWKKSIFEIEIEDMSINISKLQSYNRDLEIHNKKLNEDIEELAKKEAILNEEFIGIKSSRTFKLLNHYYKYKSKLNNKEK